MNTSRSNEDHSTSPSRPDKLTTAIEHAGDRLTMTVPQRGGPGCFLLLWLTGWTVGCVFLAGMVVADPAPWSIAFAVPFWAAWLLVAALVVWSFAGKEQLSLGGDQVEFVRTAIITLSQRVVPLDEVHGARTCRSRIQENDQYLWGIEVKTVGKPFKFGFRLPERERLWLISQLNEILGQIKSGESQTPPLPLRIDPESDSPGGNAVALHPGNTSATPPSDNSWVREDDFDSVTFHQRGRLQVGALCILLFINAFWNGIVSVFVMVLFGLAPGNNPAPHEIGWWGLFVFLIPFEVIGLLMFAALVVVLAEPFRQTWLRCERDRVVVESRWPFFRRRREWDVPPLDRLELRHAREQEGGKIPTVQSFGSDRDYRLVFVTRENSDLCSIDTLTSGEARWLAGHLHRDRPEWFG